MNWCMNKIIDGLYVGSLFDARDKEQLEKNKITHILSILGRTNDLMPAYKKLLGTKKSLNVSYSDPTIDSIAKSLRGIDDVSKIDEQKPIAEIFDLFEDKCYLCVIAEDSMDQNLAQYFSVCNDFIHSARLSGDNVLIHCLAGVSRSVSIAIAYIMTISNLSMEQALSFVRRKRIVANPNLGFKFQLQQYGSRDLQLEKNRLATDFPISTLKDTDDKTFEEFLKNVVPKAEGVNEESCVGDNVQVGEESKEEKAGGLFNFTILFPKSERKPFVRRVLNSSGVAPNREGTQLMSNVYLYTPLTKSKSSNQKHLLDKNVTEDGGENVSTD